MDNKYTCTDCGIINCQRQNSEYPEFCPTKDLTDEDMNELLKIYHEENNGEISRISAEIESDFYCRYTRVEEIIEFAKRLKFKKIGIATCVGLIDESRVFAKILRKNGFEVYAAVCKIGAMKKTDITDIDVEKTKVTGNIMCNPILQAKVLNNEDTDLNVVVGLCVGHDSLFYKYSKSLVTTLVTKDRVLAHNPVGALYQTNTYYKKLLRED
ncbi:MAG: metal-binding protein [Methanosphaera sp. rholeuAM130]|nr:MAG: metal-binding protein [Methanosphaera sp. rholeuAM130]